MENLLKNKSDEELIKAVANKDESAFEILVEKYKYSVLNIIYRYTANRTEAEDISQDIFVKIWHSADSFKYKSKVSTWIYKVVVNYCLNFKNKNKINANIQSLDELSEKGEIIIDSSREHKTYENQETDKIVRESINKLPERYKMVLVLSRFESKSYQEISEIMNLSIPAVESLIFRAKANLKKVLLPYFNKKIGI
ncbi:MAG: sigma-70 family RNA polymerase sigma factor [bacterium]|nr:sigma-70 family RNA polymerase sigma factor [bacterium]